MNDFCPVYTQANKRFKNLTEREENSGRITEDLIVEIFLRLPAKSVARYRCISKRWASLLRLPYFTELFLIRSSSRPQILFAWDKGSHVFFFSSPQPQSLSILATSYYHMKLPHRRYGYSFDVRYSSIEGLVFLRVEPALGGHGAVSVLCNPSTGQSFILPRVKTRRKIGVRSYFGYDPVEKQYKVLSMTWVFDGGQWLEHQVLTLGGKELSWRKIECSIPYNINHEYQHICINGVLYYTAKMHTGNFIIVCFDVWSEKFSFVTVTGIYTQMFQWPLLINYNGKLALGHDVTISGSCRNILLRVLDDVEEQVWLQHIYVLPNAWKNMVGDTFARFVGVTQTNEIVLSSSSLQCGEKHNHQS